MAKTDLSEALTECSLAAKSGYALASDERRVLDGILCSAEDKIKETFIEYKASPCQVIGIDETLENQLSEIQRFIDNLRVSFNEDLEYLGENLEKFSITLFGRTMAGKSTLMEVLTEGDGSAIGMGAQRTTRDIRKYEWNGLSVTDVPGIGAYEGDEDTRLAFDAAKTADLIIFLLTDDAPQAVEADCFRQVREFGKPVIVIMNIKVSVESGKSMKLIERDMNRAFDYDRIEDIRQQFCRFAEPYGQDWTSVPFVATHLKAAYEAVRCERSSDESVRAQAEFWRNISRIDVLKSVICEQVQVRGKYIRIKTFADIIANPMIETLSGLDLQSEINSSYGRIIADKRSFLEKRKEVFVKSNKKRIESFMMRLKTEFRSDIAVFAEEHYNDKLADVKWNNHVKSKDLDGRCRMLFDEMKAEADDLIQETIREMTSELKYASIAAMEQSFLTAALVDTRRIVNWTNIALGSGGVIAAFILGKLGLDAVSGPIGWISAAVTLVGGLGILLVESRGDKLARARARLEEELKNNANATCDNIWSQLEKNLDRLVKEEIDLVLSELTKIENVIRSLSSTQTSIADSLRQETRSLNITFTERIASAVFGEELSADYLSGIGVVARIPGDCMLVAEKTGGLAGTEFGSKMSDLVSEDIGFITYSDDPLALASNVLEGYISPESMEFDEENNTVVVKAEEKNIRLLNRLHLAEQLMRFKIGG